MTTVYNVYRVKFAQGGGAPPHVGIALVPAQFQDQDKGRFYHVKGAVGIGMDYEIRPRYDFGKSRTYSSKEYVFQLPAEKLQSFEAVSYAEKPPHDPRVMQHLESSESESAGSGLHDMGS